MTQINERIRVSGSKERLQERTGIRNEENESVVQTALQIKRTLLRNLKGIHGFSLQVSTILERMSVPRTTLETQIIHIRKHLSFSFPSPFQLGLCGSAVHNLYQCGSNIDFHLAQSHVTIMSELQRLYLVVDTLKENHGFNNPKILSNQNRKVVICQHPATGLDVTIDVVDRLQVHNTKLIKYYAELNETTKKVMFILKFWAKTRDIVTEQLTSYAFCWLVIFYLQCEYDLPSVASLQSREKEKIDDWICSFEAKSLANDVLAQTPIATIMANFFAFYSKFDFYTFVVCPYLGRPVRKTDFRSAKCLKDVGLYIYASVYTQKIFDMELSLCVQDPIEQCKNLTFGTPLAHVSKFQTFCNWCSGYLSGSVVLFPQAFTRMESPEDVFAFTMHRKYSEVDLDKWFKKLENLIITMLKSVVLANVTMQDGWGIYEELDWVEYDCDVQDDVWTGRYDAVKQVVSTNPEKTELEQECHISNICRKPKPMYKLSFTLKLLKIESSLKINFLGNLKHHYLHPIKSFLHTHLVRWMAEWEEKYVDCKMQPYIELERMDMGKFKKSISADVGQMLPPSIIPVTRATPEIKMDEIISAIRTMKEQMDLETNRKLSEPKPQKEEPKVTSSPPKTVDVNLQKSCSANERDITSPKPSTSTDVLEKTDIPDLDSSDSKTSEKTNNPEETITIDSGGDNYENMDMSIESGEVTSSDDDDVPDDFFDDFNKEEFLDDLVQSAEPEGEEGKPRPGSPDSVVFISERPAKKKKKDTRKRQLKELRRYQEDFMQEVRDKIEKGIEMGRTSTSTAVDKPEMISGYSYTDPSVAYPSNSTLQASNVAMVAPYCPTPTEPQSVLVPPMVSAVTNTPFKWPNQYMEVKKRIEVLSRCHDALKVLNNKFEKFVVVPTTKRDKKPSKGQSPLSRIPIVRFQFTSLLKTPNKDELEVALNKLLKSVNLDYLPLNSCADCIKRLGTVESLSIGVQVEENYLEPKNKASCTNTPKEKVCSPKPRRTGSKDRGVGSRSRSRSLNRTKKVTPRRTRSRSRSRPRARPQHRIVSRSRSRSRPRFIRRNRSRSRSRPPVLGIRRSPLRSRVLIPRLDRSRSRSKSPPRVKRSGPKGALFILRSRSRSNGPKSTVVRSRSKSRPRWIRRSRSKERRVRSRSKSRGPGIRSRSRSRRRSLPPCKSTITRMRSRSTSKGPPTKSFRNKNRSKSRSVERSPKVSVSPFKGKKSLSRSPPRSRL